MKAQRLVFLFCMLTIFTQSYAQELSYGFKVGLNYSKFNGPAEQSASGENLEEDKFNTGFHVGADLRIALTDLVGFKTGLTFNQRGGERRYDGTGFQFFIANSGNRVKASGNRRAIVSVTNSYLDIPLTAYYRLGEKIEVFGGAQLSFLVGSQASGDLMFNGNSMISDTEIDLSSVLLDYNFYRDNPPTVQDLENGLKVINFEADGERITLPESLTAYYDFAEKDGSFFNVIDVGLQAGVNFYINRGLYAGFNFNYGLTDVTNDVYDVSRSESNGLEYIERNDKDNNVTLQMSLGFSF